MDSEEDDFYYDSEEEISDGGLDDDYLGVDSSEPAAKRPYDDDFQYECLTPESIVSTMNKSIEDVNNVFQVNCITSTKSHLLFWFALGLASAIA